MSKLAIQPGSSQRPLPAAALSPSPTLSPGDKSKRSRASKPKVKTGCQTCKIRRVKCDEAKPSCMRCLRFGHQCDGYPNLPSSRKSATASSNKRTLVPKQLSALKALVPSSIEFAHGQERHCFQSFCERTKPAKVGSEQWQSMLERCCHDEAAIRDAVLAVGRLDLRPNRAGFTEEVGTLKHFASFRLFGKSCFYLQRGSYEVRSTCFSTLLYHFGGMELHLEERSTCSGLRKLREWCSQNAVLEPADEDSFDEIELSVLQDADTRNARHHSMLRDGGNDLISQMTDQFRDVAQARETLELLLSRSIHWLASGLHTLDFGNSSKERKRGKMFMTVTEMAEEEHTSMIEEYRRWETACRPLLEECRTMKLIMREEYTELLTLRLLWLSGYLNCASHLTNGNIKHVRFRSEMQELVQIAQLLLQQQTSTSQASTPTTTAATAAAAAAVMDDSSDAAMGGGIWWGKPSNYTDLNVRSIISLMSIAWTYRHRTLRKIAIALLLAGPNRDGGYEGVLLGKMMAWLNALEEEEDDGVAGLADEEAFIPQDRAAKMVKFALDVDSRTAELSCSLLVNGGLVRKEAVISW